MSLRDVVSNMGGTLLAEVALVLFFLIFVGIVAYVFLRRKSYWERIGRIPLDDEGTRPDPGVNHADTERGKV